MVAPAQPIEPTVADLIAALRADLAAMVTQAVRDAAPPKFVTEQGAARYLGLGKNAVAALDGTHGFPRPVLVGGRETPMYRTADLDRWAASRKPARRRAIAAD